MAVSSLMVFINIYFAMRWPTEAQQRIGCFSFNHDNTVLPALTGQAKSIEECTQRCQARRDTYGEQLNDSSCTTSCNDHMLRCGGQNSIVIYSVVQLTTEAATSLAIDNMVTDSGQSDTHDPPVIAIAALSLIVVAALIVYLRRRRSDRQSYDGDNETKSLPATDTSTQAKADLSMKQTESGPTTTPTAPPMLNYSTVDFSNNGPVHIDDEDISKSDDDVVIHRNHEKLEYAVVRKPADTTHANFKENSLYGAYNGDSDEENVD